MNDQRHGAGELTLRQCRGERRLSSSECRGGSVTRCGGDSVAKEARGGSDVEEAREGCETECNVQWPH